METNSANKYYKLNRMLLLSIGLWPYDESIFKRVKILLTFSLVISFIVVMIAKIITSKYDMALTFRNLSLIVPCCIIILKYITFLLLPTNLKTLMEWVQNDWNSLKDENELKIIKKYANFGRFCTISFSVFTTLILIGAYNYKFIIIVFGYTSSLGFVIYFPGFLDFIAPLNSSRPQKLPIEVEYFIDEQKYFNIIYYHMCTTAIFGITILLATELLYIAYVSHACGMFKITSYRLQHAYDQNVLRISSSINNAMIHTKIIAAIEMHKRAFKFSDFIWSSLAISYSVLLFIGVISLIVNLFRVFQAIVVIKNVDELVISIACVFGHFVYMLAGNYVGQVFIDHSLGIYEDVCDTQWYHVSVRQQKIILFILHRSLSSCKLVGVGTFVLSLEGFATLLATSISYLTVLISVQS